MKPDTQEWIDKAEGDFTSALVLYRARKTPNYDAACFHTQQCAEKYLKARLEEAGLAIPRTHNLYALLMLVSPLEPTWRNLAADLNVLTSFAVAYRYPKTNAVKADAKDAINRCRKIRSIIRQSFGLPA
ncbi:MAG: HEPN domain-containing protein [Acidobacteriota bacterium]